MQVSVHNVLTGAAAEAGAVRVNFGDQEAVILMATELTVEERAGLLGELLGPDDTVMFTVVVPDPRAPAAPVSGVA